MSELDPVHIDDSHACVPHYYELLKERDVLKAELERLSGKTGFCTLCEGYARELESVKALLARVEEFGVPPLKTFHALESKLEIARVALQTIAKSRPDFMHLIAKDALSRMEGK